MNYKQKENIDNENENRISVDVTTDDNAIIHCEITGKQDAHALIFLHGNGENLHIFDKQVSYFSQYYRTIAIDTRGHGKSTRGTEPFDFYTFSSDLKNVLKALKIDKANIVGFSDGANIALQLAVFMPDVVSSMILLGANYNPKGLKMTLRLYLLLVYVFLTTISLFSKEYRKRKEIWGLMIHHPDILITELKQITAPTLVVTGEKDLIRKHHNDMICNSIKECQRLEIKGGNHFWIFKKPEILNQIIIDFLQKHIK